MRFRDTEGRVFRPDPALLTLGVFQRAEWQDLQFFGFSMKLCHLNPQRRQAWSYSTQHSLARILWI